MKKLIAAAVRSVVVLGGLALGASPASKTSGNPPNFP
jgi:hypothetical protein